MNKYLKNTLIIIFFFVILFSFGYFTRANEEQEKWISSFYSKYCYLESQVHKNIKEKNKVEFETLEECEDYLNNKN